MKICAFSLFLLSASTASAYAPAPKANPSSDVIVMNNVGSKWAYNAWGATYQDLPPARPNTDPSANDGFGSKWAYQPFGATYQELPPARPNTDPTAADGFGSKWAYNPFGATYQDLPPARVSTDPNAADGFGSKWAYNPFGATYQDLPRAGPSSTDPSKWYFQPWSGVTQSQFIPLDKRGVDMWYFEPRSVVPPDDEFFHGYNSASHMWVPNQLYAEPQPFSAPPAPSTPALGASEQAAVPPSQPQQTVPEPVMAQPAAPQMMPEPTAQKMPDVDPTMAAYDKAMSGN